MNDWTVISLSVLCRSTLILGAGDQRQHCLLCDIQYHFICLPEYFVPVYIIHTCLRWSKSIRSDIVEYWRHNCVDSMWLL